MFNFNAANFLAYYFYTYVENLLRQVQNNLTLFKSTRDIASGVNKLLWTNKILFEKFVFL